MGKEKGTSGQRQELKWRPRFIHHSPFRSRARFNYKRNEKYH